MTEERYLHHENDNEHRVGSARDGPVAAHLRWPAEDAIPGPLVSRLPVCWYGGSQAAETSTWERPYWNHSIVRPARRSTRGVSTPANRPAGVASVLPVMPDHVLPVAPTRWGRACPRGRRPMARYATAPGVIELAATNPIW